MHLYKYYTEMNICSLPSGSFQPIKPGTGKFIIYAVTEGAQDTLEAKGGSSSFYLGGLGKAERSHHGLSR